MRRREFITVLAGVAATSPFAALAQQPGPLVGSAYNVYPRTIRRDSFAPLHSGASSRRPVGRSVGNLQINYRWGTGDADWLRSAAAQVLRLAPDVMLANGDAAVKAALQSTRTVPIIFIASGDPVRDGLVQSLSHPGGNLTGFAVMEPSLGAKLLAMLKEVAPRVTRVAVLVDPAAPHTR